MARREILEIHDRANTNGSDLLSEMVRLVQYDLEPEEVELLVSLRDALVKTIDVIDMLIKANKQ